MYITIGLVYLILNFGLFFFASYLKLYQHRDYRFLFAYYLASSISELILEFHAFQGIQNHFVINFYLLVETFTISLVFNKWIVSELMKKMALLFIVVFIVAWCWVFSKSDLNILSPKLMVFQGIVLSCFAVCYLLQLMRNTNLVPYNEVRFWIAAGLLVFYAGTLIINSAASLLYTSASDSLFGQLFFFITLSVNLTTIVLNYVGLLCFYKKKS